MGEKTTPNETYYHSLELECLSCEAIVVKFVGMEELGEIGVVEPSRFVGDELGLRDEDILVLDAIGPLLVV